MCAHTSHDAVLLFPMLCLLTCTPDPVLLVLTPREARSAVRGTFTLYLATPGPGRGFEGRQLLTLPPWDAAARASGTARGCKQEAGGVVRVAKVFGVCGANSPLPSGCRWIAVPRCCDLLV